MDLEAAELPGASTALRRIIRAAREDFLAHGFRGVTMDELAQRLGMSKKTLYAHFSSKTALVEAVLLDKFRDVETQLKRITSECSADFLGALRQLLARLQESMAEIRPPFLRDIQRESPQLFALVERRRKEVIQRYFGKLFVEGRKAGIVRKDIPVHLMVEILLGAVQAIVNPPKLAELELPPETAAIAIIRVVLEGIITEQGRARL
jgi:AcrR family transcriptional regulator